MLSAVNTGVTQKGNIF